MKSIFKKASDIEISLMLQEAAGIIKNPSVGIVLDDHAIHVWYQKIVPLKRIEFIVTIGRKEIKNEWKRQYSKKG